MTLKMLRSCVRVQRVRVQHLWLMNLLCLQELRLPGRELGCSSRLLLLLRPPALQQADAFPFAGPRRRRGKVFAVATVRSRRPVVPTLKQRRDPAPLLARFFSRVLGRGAPVAVHAFDFVHRRGHVKVRVQQRDAPRCAQAPNGKVRPG